MALAGEEMGRSSSDLLQDLNWKAVVERSAEALLLLDESGVVRYANPAACTFMGRPAGDIEGVSFGIPMLQSNEAGAQGNEVEIHTPGGQVHMGALAVRPFHHRGAPWRLVSIRDLTSLREAEERLRQSQLALNDAERLAGVGSWRVNLDTSEVYWSEQIGRICETEPGYQPSLEEGLSLYDSPYREQVLAALTEAREGGGSFEVEARITTARGNAKWVRVYGGRMETPEGPVLAGACQDITSQRETSRERDALASIVDNTNDICVMKDLDLRVVATNRAFARAAGYSSTKPLLGKTDAEIFGLPQDQEPVAGYMADERQAQRLGPGEFILREEDVVYPDGEVRRFLTRKYPVFNEAGELTGTANTSSDITQLRQAERDAHTNAVALARAQAIGHIGSWTFAGQDLPVRCSHEMLRMLGRSSGHAPDVPFQEFLEAFGEGDRPLVEASLFSALENGTGFELETTLDAGGARARVVELRAEVEQFKNEVRVVGTALDVTERRRRDAAHAELVSVVESSFEAIFIADNSGRIEYVNPAFVRITGWSREEILGEHVSMLYGPRDNPEFYLAIWDSIAHGKSWRGKMRHLRKDGAPFSAELSVSSIQHSQDSRHTKLVCIARDVTHELELEDQLRQSQKMEAIGTLAGGIAHDFNNVLYAILGFAEVGLDEEGLPGASRHCFEQIIQGADRASELVNRILSFSRESEGEMQQIDMAALVTECMALVRGSIPPSTELRMSITPCPPVHGDPVQMHQVVLNFCTNALHAMGAVAAQRPGLLRIILEPAPGQRAFPGASEDQAYVRLVVEDNGHGMDAATRERIFEPYFTTKKVGEGSGLGLSTVHGIVRSHQGHIAVESTPGEGSRFEVYLPVSHHAPAPEAPGKGAESPALGQGHVLLVDDDHTVGKVTEMLLKQLGFTVTLCLDPAGALDYLGGNDPVDYVLSDYMMPGMNGIELCRQAKNLHPDIPVLICTGYAEQLSEEDALGQGVDAYLRKPAKKQALAEALYKAAKRGKKN